MFVVKLFDHAERGGNIHNWSDLIGSDRIGSAAQMVLAARHLECVGFNAIFADYWSYVERTIYHYMPLGSKNANLHSGKPFPLNMTGCSWRLYRLYGNHRIAPINKIERKKRNVKLVLPVTTQKQTP